MVRLKGILKNARARTTLQQVCANQDGDLDTEVELVPNRQCEAIMSTNSDSDDLEEDNDSDAIDWDSSEEEESASDNESIASIDPDDIPPLSERVQQQTQLRKKPRQYKKKNPLPRKRVRISDRVDYADSPDDIDMPAESSGTPSVPANTPATVEHNIQTVFQIVKRPDGTDVYVCPHCAKRKVYVRLSNLEKHIRDLHSGRPLKFKCPQCDLPCATHGALTRHLNKQYCHRNFVQTPRKVFIPQARPETSLGPALDFSRLKPVEFFLWLFTNSILIWVKFTNINGQILHGTKWRKFSLSDAFRWLSLFNARSLLGIHRQKDPWRRWSFFSNDFFVDTMSARRWFMIFRSSCFVDKVKEQLPGGRGNKDSPIHDRLWRVADPIDAFLQICQRSWNPGLHLAIDEMMTKFLGWCNFLVRMPKKPIKRGIKSFVLACGKTAFILNWIPFVKQKFSKHAEFGATGSTVFALLSGENVTNGRNFLDQGYYIFTDSYYTMLGLIERLLERVTYYCGTLAKCRHLPDGFKELILHDGTKMTRGVVKFLHWGKITLSNWLDSASVIIASTLPHVVEQMTMCKRQVFNHDLDKWELKIVPCPTVVEEYNKYMAGVDRADQIIAAYHVHTRQKKWFMTLWFRLIEMAMLNAHILYQHTFPGTKMADFTLDFQVSVIEGLVQIADKMDGIQTQKHMTVFYPDDYEFDLEYPIAPIVPRNMNSFYRSRSGQKLLDKLRFNKKSMHMPHPCAIRKRCVCCGFNFRTNICCGYCKVALHPGRCYERWHKMVKYRYK